MSTVRGVEYRFSIPKYAGARSMGKRWGTFAYGSLSALRLREFPAPKLRGPRWARLVPIYSGICGTDLSIVTARTSVALEPFSSFPAVMGHETLARVDEAGGEVGNVKAGQRVVVDPFLHCGVRGIEPCFHCARGETAICRNTARGGLAPGMILGTCADLPGSWSEAMVAHACQLFPVPDALSDERAALIEPISVGMRGVLKANPPSGSRVLVIGGGTIGLCTVAALELLGVDAEVTVLARYDFQRDVARALGADETPTARAVALLREAADAVGAQLYKPVLGRPVLNWGYDVVFDCVGSRSSVDDGLRLTRPGGTFVLLGGAGELPKVDWTFVWARELAVLGSCGYGQESWRGETTHTFSLTMDLLMARPDLPVESMITHVYPLADYRRALRDALNRRQSKAIKVLLQAT